MNLPEGTIRFIDQLSDLPPVEDAFDRLARDSQIFVPLFRDVLDEVAQSGREFCFAVVRDPTDAGVPAGMAMIVRSSHRSRFAVGERQITETLDEAWSIYRNAVVGRIEAGQWQRIFAELMRRAGNPQIVLGEIAVDTPLEQAARSSAFPLLPVRKDDRPSIHWLIDLPESFDAYLALLRSSTRQSLRRKINKFERDPANRLEVLTRPDQVDGFLQMGEPISRQTYQWNVGQRLENIPAIRDRFHALAAQGRLRCYLLFHHDQPIAFLYGEISGDTFLYHTPGYLPEFSDLSPGLVLLAHTLRDLIEQTDCRLFDFGEGGDHAGYKSRFGTRFLECRNLALANMKTSGGIRFWSLSQVFRLVKSAGRAVLKNDELKRRFKKAIRTSDA